MTRRTPARLRKWLEKRAAKDTAERDRNHPPLPVADAEFWEIETFREFGGGDWVRWYAQPAIVRGRLMAHLVEKANREAYEMAHKPPEKKAADAGENGRSMMQKLWGFGAGAPVE